MLASRSRTASASSVSRAARAAVRWPPATGWPPGAAGLPGTARGVLMWLAARSNSTAPSASMSSTSWPSGILIAASCCQRAIGSPQASTWNCHVPVEVTVTSPPYRSLPSASSRIGTSG